MSFEDLQPIIDQLKETLAPLAPLHDILRQKVLGPLNGYTLLILAIQVSASHILVKEEAKIKELQTILERFAELAKANSVCPSGKQGDLWDTVVGAVSPIIKTQFGYHLITVTKKPEA
ncbi:UNVERIFIED_CONTAM: hypothetical protein HDU68_006686 [Siphonaria sp. JEL0065]|nr:hypothetical protein HDU68_006686 [Siphonaria sp. JEL0065]